MIFYYAPGGGLGHLMRAKAVKHTLALPDPVILCASSPFARDFSDDFEILEIPSFKENQKTAFQQWLHGQIKALAPRTIYLDTFPCGIMGEWENIPLPGTDLIYIGRKLKWKEYPFRKAPLFEKSFLTENIDNEHNNFICNHSKTVETLLLQYVFSPHRLLPPLPAHFWLIVHSTPAEEVRTLAAYALEKKQLEKSAATLLLISRDVPADLPEEIRVIDVQPACLLFEQAARIFSACGANLMRELLPYAHKHYFIPFERRYDDQPARAKERRTIQLLSQP